MEKPVMSLGVMSGVNWMRLNEQSSDRARALASVVLPTPGTSSINTCPRHSIATIISSMVLSLPTMTLPTFFVSSWANRCVTCIMTTPCLYLLRWTNNDGGLVPTRVESEKWRVEMEYRGSRFPGILTNA